MSLALAREAGWDGAAKTSKAGGRPKDNTGRAKALTAIVADILVGTAKSRTRRFWRERSARAFTGLPVSYRAFDDAWKWLQAEGWIREVYGATFQATNMFDGTPLKDADRKAARWEATEGPFAFVEAQGFKPEDAAKHFAERLPKDVIELRQTSKIIESYRIKGRRLKFPETPKTKALADTIHEINRFLAEQDLGGLTFLGFKRIFFKLPNAKGFSWNHGGRLYSFGDRHFQGLSKEDRLKVKINGEPVVELDVKASHLTIYCGLTGEKASLGRDPYKITGLPRELVKAWVVKAFGTGGLPNKYPQYAYADYKAAHPGKELGRGHPIRRVEAAILKSYPTLKKLPSTKWNSLALEFYESEAVIGTMLELLKAGIPSLPVHDSLVVPKNAKSKAKAILERQYKTLCGIKPRLEEVSASTRKRKA
ncbi:MAG: hypothetical protein WBG82_12420 [Parvibaculum sp.]